MWAVLGRGVALVVFVTALGACNAGPAPTSAAEGLASLLTSSHWVSEMSHGHWAVGDYAGGAYYVDELGASLVMTPGGLLMQAADNTGFTFTRMDPADRANRNEVHFVTSDDVAAATLDPSGNMLWLQVVDDRKAEQPDHGVTRIDLTTGALTKIGGVAQRDGTSQSSFVWSQTGHTLILVRCTAVLDPWQGHCPWTDVTDTSTLAVRSFEQAVRPVATTDEFAIASDERDPNVRQFAIVDLVSGDVRPIAQAITDVGGAHVVDGSQFIVEGTTDASPNELLEIVARTGAETKLDEVKLDAANYGLVGPWTPMSRRWVVLISPPVRQVFDEVGDLEGRVYDLEQHEFSEQTAQIRLP